MNAYQIEEVTTFNVVQYREGRVIESWPFNSMTAAALFKMECEEADDA